MSTTVVPPQAYTKQDLSKAFKWMLTQPEEIQKMIKSESGLVGLYRKALLYGASSIANTPTSSTNEFKSELKDLAGQINDFEEKPAEIPTEKPKYSSSVSYQSSKGLPPWAESTKTDSLFSKQTPVTQTTMPSEPATPVYNAPRQQESEKAYLNQTLKQDPYANYQQTMAPQEPTMTYQQPPQTPVRKPIPEVAVNYQAGEPELSVSFQRPEPSPEPVVPSMPKPLNLPDISTFGNQVEIDTNSRAMLQEIRRKLNLSSDQEALRMLISLGYEKFKKVWS